MKKHVILLAAGSGTRMRSATNKILLDLCGKTLLRRSIEAFRGLIDQMVVVYSSRDELSEIQKQVCLSNADFPVELTAGGPTRHQSVLRGIRFFSYESEDIVLIHDAARCLVEHDLIAGIIEKCMSAGNAIPGIPVTSTFKVCDSSSRVLCTPDRSNLYEVQTPQAFHAVQYLELAEKAEIDAFEGTDDASLFEHFGVPVNVIPGLRSNIKITHPDDLLLAGFFLKGEKPVERIGYGYDVHRLVPDRQLVLCGVEIPYHLGLLGHSDADVALHALMDAMLGAAALGDIGKHFPDRDPAFKGISSLILLKKTNQLLLEAGYTVSNADITIVVEKPKLLPYIPSMIQKISDTLEISHESVNVKATTTEGLGFEGVSDGISSHAVCMIRSIIAK